MSFLAYELWAASACITQTYLISPETHGPWQPTHKKEETTHTGNTKQQKHRHTHTHTKVHLHPTWIGALGMCLRYPVPCLAAFLPWKFLRGMDHQPNGGGYSTNVVFILLSEHTNFLRKGYPRRKHTQSRGGDPPSCIGQPRLGYLNLMCGPPRPPTFALISK